MKDVAIIGSTPIHHHELLDAAAEEEVATRAGTVRLLRGRVRQVGVVLLTRSNGQIGVPSHLVNYRANILALREIGVQRVIATSVVGSLTSGIPVGTVLVLDQFLDFTRSRDITLFGDRGFAQVDITDPYCEELRRVLLASALAHLDIEQVRSHGCYVGNDGPRFQTRAEVEMFRRLGGDVIGQTNLPEAVLAREAGLCYASLAIVSNLGAGLAERVDRRDQQQTVSAYHKQLSQILRDAVQRMPSLARCTCASAAEDFQTPRTLETVEAARHEARSAR